MKILALLVLAGFIIFISTVAKSEIITEEGISDKGIDVLESLALLDSFTSVELSGELRDKYNSVVLALSRASNARPGSEDAAEKIQAADRAFSEFVAAYGNQLEQLSEISDESYDEIFKAIDWSSDAFAMCIGFRSELLALLTSALDAVAVYQNSDLTLNDDLAECEERVNVAASRLNALITDWEEEIVAKQERVAELRRLHQEAVEAGDESRAAEIQNEIDRIEDEEIPEIQRNVERARKVRASFDLEKLLTGLGKVALGIVTVLFSGECGQEAQGSCENVGFGLIADGLKDVGESFDPPDKTEHYTETETQPAERSAEVVRKQDEIQETLESQPSPLCCNPPDIRPNLVIVETNEEGPLTFAYETNGQQLVSTIYLIKNIDGSILAEINDDVLFYAKGEDSHEVSTMLFRSLENASTVVTSEDTHLVVFKGTLISGGSATLGVAIVPLTFSGKYKVVFRPIVLDTQ